MWRTCSRSKNWNVPPTFPFIFVFLSKLSRQQDSNSDRRIRRRGRWPLDHHHCHQQNWRDRKIRFQQDLNPCSFSHMSSVLLLCCRYCSKENQNTPSAGIEPDLVHTSSWQHRLTTYWATNWAQLTLLTFHKPGKHQFNHHRERKHRGSVSFEVSHKFGTKLLIHLLFDIKALTFPSSRLRWDPERRWERKREREKKKKKPGSENERAASH